MWSKHCILQQVEFLTASHEITLLQVNNFEYYSVFRDIYIFYISEYFHFRILTTQDESQ